MMVKKIRADWLEAPFSRAVIEAIGADSLRFVGGAVRDTILGFPVKDIDAATSLRPEETLKRLSAAGIRAVPTGLAHGTVTAVSRDDPPQTVEITTLRHDVLTDGRHAKVAFTADWRADAERRDFTFNAIYLSADGAVFDPFDGQADLLAGHLRFIGNAEDRIAEDALRILRFFRFYARFGKGAPDGEAIAACRARAAMVARLSAERVRDEILKLLVAPHALAAWQALLDCGVAHHLPVPLTDIDKLQHMAAREANYGLQPNALMRLAALAGGSGTAIGRLGKALKLSGKEQAVLRAIGQGASAPAPQDSHAVRALVYRAGHMAALASLLFSPAQAPAEWVQIAVRWPAPEMPVKGRDLLALGMAAGPAISARLRDIEDAWVASDFQLQKADLLKAT